MGKAWFCLVPQVALSEDLSENDIQYHGGYLMKKNATIYLIW
jgi:hypothetical protein